MTYNVVGGVFMYYVVFNSITLATRVRNYFRYSNSRTQLVHTPSEISKGGCSYSIVVENQLVAEVIKVAKEYGIKVLGVYRETEDSYVGVTSYDLS